MTMTMVPTRADDVVSTSQPTISRNSITQHYHHSSHVVTQAPTSDTRADLVTTQNISDPLCQHGLNPAASSSAQLDLLRNADAAQGQRFIQTWQFYSRPQDSPIQDHEMKDSAVGVAEDHSGNAEPYMISGYEVGVGRSTSTPREPTTGEPYSASTDPVYNSQQWWELPRTVPMESQYGLFEERSRYYTTCGVAQSQ
ncbi:hypothetical protein N7532_010401 [Penicillium argentinense]|uniref:Uncharacterized protein n=1 Tax=Penicillium argentinense TaxID=1131581 RepID=A0A9W9EPR8_9EURO|nr:uncharacterized protein N7532_010401 [Penicillium argentinense]KAJ5085630.1 hypothetical protein N7532_010401 [Penicillium argentinense]